MRRVFGISLLVLLTAGCATIPVEPYTGLPVVLPDSGSDTAPFEEAVARRLSDLKTFRGRGIIRIEPPKQRAREFDYLVMAARDEGMRLRATRAIGPVFFELIANDTSFAISIPPRREFYLGEQESESMAQSAVLDPGGIVDPLRLTLVEGSMRKVEYRRSEIRLTEYFPSHAPGEEVLAQEIRFDRETGLISSLDTYDGDGALEQHIKFDGYKALDGLSPDNAFPMLVHVERPQVGFTIELRFREITPNPSISPAAFDMTPPKGYRVKPVSELDPSKVDQMEREVTSGS